MREIARRKTLQRFICVLLAFGMFITNAAFTYAATTGDAAVPVAEDFTITSDEALTLTAEDVLEKANVKATDFIVDEEDLEIINGGNTGEFELVLSNGETSETVKVTVAEDENTGNDSQTAEEAAQTEATESQSSEEITAADFAVTAAEAKALTPESAREKAGVTQEDVTVNKTELETIKAGDTGEFPLTFSNETTDKTVVVTIAAETEKETEPATEAESETEKPVKPRESVTDDRVKLDIPQYDPAAGWDAGMVYDVTATFDFTGMGENQRFVEVVLPEGMRYVAYPVVGQIDEDRALIEYQMTSPTNGLTESILDKPVRRPITATYYGRIRYKITDGAGIYELKFKVTPDEKLAYGDKFFKDAITAAGSADGEVLGKAGMDVNIKYQITSAKHMEGMTGSAQLGDNDTPFQPPNFWISGKTPFCKEIEYTMYYPVGATFHKVNSTAAKDVEYDDEQGYVKFRLENIGPGAAVGTMAIQLKTGNLAAGVHSASKMYDAKLTFYDGTTYEAPAPQNPVRLTIRVTDPSTQSNKMTIVSRTNNFLDVSDDAQPIAYSYFLKGNSVREVTNQWIEITIDQNYHAEMITFPMGQNGATELKYKTNLDNTERTAPVENIKRSGESYSRPGISIQTLGLAPGEYITSLKVKMGDFPRNFQTSLPSYRTQTIHAAGNCAISGRLDKAATSAKIKVQTYELDDNGDIIEETRVVDDSAEIKHETAKNQSFRTGEGKLGTVSMMAGETKEATATLNMQGFCEPISIIKSPMAVFKIPSEDVEFFDFSATQNGLPVAVEVSDQYTVKGENYIKVVCDTLCGGFANNRYYGSITLNFKIRTNITAKGTYKWYDGYYWMIEDNNARMTTLFSAAVLDADDVDNDGSTTDWLMKMVASDTSSLIINDQKALLIDTYIKPVGEERQPNYDLNNPQSAVGFTPGTNGEYTVEIFNNRENEVSDFYTYLPVPKRDVNFGDKFQSQKFKWNMKVTGTPKVETFAPDGTPDTSLAGKYVIGYNSQSLSESDYQKDAEGSAALAWDTSSSAATSMIRIKLDQPMQPGERAIITFSYIVDEDEDSVKNNDKLGSINDFRPYAYFVAGSSGWINGSRVGALLQIGSIEGRVFLDKDADGIKNGSDTDLANAKVSLYKSGEAVVFKEVNTEADGSFKFSNLPAGTYKVDFNNVLTTAGRPYFTLKDKAGTGEIGSMVNNVGTDVGVLVNVDPTKDNSKGLSAGVLDYKASDLKVSLNKASVTIAEVNDLTDPEKPKDRPVTAQVSHSIEPDFFNSIKAASGAEQYSSTDPSKITVSSTGLISSVKEGEGTAKAVITVTDMFGNSASAETNVTVESDRIPVLTLTAASKVLEIGDAFDAASYITSVTDKEDGTIPNNKVVISGQPTLKDGKLSKIETVTTKYQVEDTHGNYTEKTISFQVKDTTDPVFNVANDEVTLELNGGTTFDQFVKKLGAITKNDNDPSAKLEVKSDDFASLDQTTISTDGSRKVNVYVKDPSGNKTGREIKVKITDTTDPIFTVEKDEVTLELGGGIDFTTFVGLLGNINKEDNDNTAKLTISSADFSSLDQDEVSDDGSKKVHIYVEDPSGNRTTLTIKVKVIDTTDPVFDVENKTVTLELNGQTTFDDFVKKLGTVDARDNDPKADLKVQSDDFKNLKQDSISTDGSRKVNVYVKDPSGNKTNITITVNVTDTKDPTFTVEHDEVTLELNGKTNFEGFLKKLGTITAVDNDTSAKLEVKSDDFKDLKQDSISTDGSRKVKIYVQDPSGNRTTLTITVKVTDTTDPIFQVTNSEVTLELNGATDFDGFVKKLGTITTDDNDTNADLRVQSDDFDNLKQDSISTDGSRKVNVYVQDPSGNKTTLTIKVKITDTTDPVFNVQNKDVTLELGANTSFADFVAKLGTVVKNDNDQNADLEIKSADFNGLDQQTVSTDGSRKVHVYVEDPSGNKTTIEIKVKVIDTTKPVFDVQNKEVTLELGGNTSFEDFITKLGTISKNDNDKKADLSIKSEDFDNLDQNTVSTDGSRSVKIYVVDPSGNKADLTIKVKITDTTKPTFNVANKEVTLELGGNIDLAGFVEKLGKVTVGDNDSKADLRVRSDDFAGLDQNTISTDGSRKVKVYVEDPTGNKTDITITVKVIDTTDPSLTVEHSEVTFELGTPVDFAGFIDMLGNVTVSDNDSSADLSLKSDDFGSFDQTVINREGSIVHVYVTDPSGNKTEIDITIKVIDVTDPVLTTDKTEVDLEVNGETTFEQFLEKVGITEANDDSGEEMVVKSDDFEAVDQTALSAGNIVKIYLEDSSSNRTEVDITVNVTDTTAPVITSELATISYREDQKIDEEQFLKDIAYAVTDNSNLAVTTTTNFADVKFAVPDGQDRVEYDVIVKAADTSANESEITVKVYIVRQTKYFVQAKDVEIDITDLNTQIANGTLEEFIIKASEAKAWKDDYDNGVTDLTVYVKSLDDLRKVMEEEEITLELGVRDDSAKSPDLARGSSDAKITETKNPEEISAQIKVKVNDANRGKLQADSLTVKKVWDDDNDKAGKRPKSITVDLYKDGIVIAELTLSKKTGWSGTFTDLPEGAANDSTYEIKERKVKGYTADYTRTTKGWTITNKYDDKGSSGDNGSNNNKSSASARTYVNTYSSRTGSSPKTGDNVNMLGWLLLLAAAGGVIYVSSRSRAKKNRHQ